MVMSEPSITPFAAGQPVVGELFEGLRLRMVTPALVREIRNQFRLDWQGIHGAPHWARVYAHGQAIGTVVGADLRVCELFAFLHDARRMDDGMDPEHGARAADYAAWLRRKGYFELEETAFALLHQACSGHSEGRVHAHLTVQVCWDSDRLDLARVGMTPAARYLCTDVAKEPERIAAAVEWSRKEGRRG